MDLMLPGVIETGPNSNRKSAEIPISQDSCQPRYKDTSNSDNYEQRDKSKHRQINY